MRKRSMFKRSRRAKERGPEEDFANRLCISAAVYLSLAERLGNDRAFEMMREVLVPIGCRLMVGLPVGSALQLRAENSHAWGLRRLM